MEPTCSVVRGIGAYKFGFVNFLLDKLGDPLMLMMQPGVFYLRCCHAGDIAKSPRQGSIFLDLAEFVELAARQLTRRTY